MFIAAYQSIYHGVPINLTGGYMVAGLTNTQRQNLAVEQVVIERQTHLFAFQELERGFMDSATALGWPTVIPEALTQVLSAEFQWPIDWQELVMGDECVHYLFLD
jgi:hypothetical protein